MPRLPWSLGAALAALAALAAPGCGEDAPDPNEITVSVGDAFTPGTKLRDAYTGATMKVSAERTVSLVPDPSGVALLERDGAAAAAFDWANVTVYHAIVDRFANGDPTNDGSYGRKKDGQMEIGTWHGGDWKGLTARLDYLADLGVTALWISPIVEQVRGWAAGGTGDFKHYGYHGYWALDFTRLDENLGTLDDLRALVDGAHQRGIRVLCDVVVNHPGYATGADLTAFLPEVWKDGTGAAFAAYDQTTPENVKSWNDLVDYNSTAWPSWWGPSWIRADLPGYPKGGTSDETRQLNFLPDFITEGGGAAGKPVLFTRKTDTGVVELPGATVRQYLVKWQADWVAQVGFDGFRVDTAKNVDKATLRALKEAGLQALAQWKAQHPGEKLDDAPFWMVGEVYPHGVVKDSYFTDGGFDSLINFDFQTQVGRLLVEQGELPDAADGLDQVYAGMASALVGDPALQVLSYLSSHDTRLNFAQLGNDSLRQRHAGTALLLAPGGVEIFYGDESGRQAGPAGTDSVQGTRSDMNFDTTDAAILAHWRKVGAFRKKHPAIGGGAHQRIPSPVGTYVFSRERGGDTVVVVIARSR